MSEHSMIRGRQAATPSAPAAGVGVEDQRLVRGARTRRKIARHGVDVASLEGLNGLSIGRLATDLGLSKSGIQTLFRTKENLQLAVAESAREEFREAVVRPAQTARPGITRLRALTEHWISYVEEPLFAGGCFWAASLPDFDSRPGKVRDALLLHRRTWLGLLAGELRQAVDTEEIALVDVDLTVFQIDAVLNAANTALRLGENDAVSKVRRVVDQFSAPPH